MPMRMPTSIIIAQLYASVLHDHHGRQHRVEFSSDTRPLHFPDAVTPERGDMHLDTNREYTGKQFNQAAAPNATRLAARRHSRCPGI